MKFKLLLEEYDYGVEYVKNSDNAAADALSLIHPKHWLDLPIVVRSHIKQRGGRFIEKFELDTLQKRNKISVEINTFCFVESKFTIFINPDF